MCCGYFINFTRDIYVSYFTNLQHVNIILEVKMINYVFGCKIRWHTTKIHANNRKNSRMRLLYIRNLVKEWLKATFRLFRHTLSHKNGVKKDTEGILNIDINNFSSTFHTDDKKKIILMLYLVSRRQRVYLLEGRSRHFNS